MRLDEGDMRTTIEQEIDMPANPNYTKQVAVAQAAAEEFVAFVKAGASQAQLKDAAHDLRAAIDTIVWSD